MESIYDDQILKRALLRDKYTQVVSNLLKELNSQAKAAYAHDELTNHGVSLGCFDPSDQKFLNSKACLFKPLSLKEFEEYSLESELNQGAYGYYYLGFDKIYDDPAKEENASSSRIMWQRAHQIFEYLDTGYTSLHKKSGDNLDFFDEVSGWDQIKHDNSFLDGGEGLMLGLRKGRYIPRWGCKAQREWQEDNEDPSTIRPHILLIICTGAEAKDNELLFGELGPTAQAIRNRLRQKEFEKTSLFPVLAVSLFGPRHGRLLQANFNNSGILEVRSSPIYSFLRKDSAPFELFLRYYACEPLDGPEYEFSDDTQTHQYISPLPGSNVKNIPPKEGDTPSAEGP
ncbi:hypothetical protein DTO271G3_32 [Paecilomyces variotii]|nr:hypothetical protein DTO271G3_32 [Paecilomyces variotii]